MRSRFRNTKIPQCHSRDATALASLLDECRQCNAAVQYFSVFTVAVKRLFRLRGFCVAPVAGGTRATGAALIGKTGITLAKVFPSLQGIVYTLRINVQQELGMQSEVFVLSATLSTRNVDILQRVALLAPATTMDK